MGRDHFPKIAISEQFPFVPSPTMTWQLLPSVPEFNCSPGQSLDCFFKPHSVLSPINPIRDQILRENKPNLGESMIVNPNLPEVSAKPGFAEMETKPSNGSSPNFVNIALKRIVFASPNVGSSVLETEAKILTDSNSRKRKTVSKGKLRKAVDEQNDRDPKQCKNSENKGIENDSTNKEEKDENLKNQDDANTKPPEPPKDYIHVRARRGQATDSHSLAERVRREKISERMKLLQDIVPGCNKVTGKALMLDEIINYVQSLQRQVEFLSMKLASVNTVDFNTDSLLFKDMNSSAYAVDSTSLFGKWKQEIHNSKTNGSTTHCSSDPSDTAMCRGISIHSPLVDEFGQSFPQFSESYRDDLLSIVMTGFGRNPSADSGLHLQTFVGSSDTTATRRGFHPQQMLTWIPNPTLDLSR